MAFNFLDIKTQVTKIAKKAHKALIPKADRNKEHFEFGLHNPAFALRSSPKRR